jgi:hypothetical protein
MKFGRNKTTIFLLATTGVFPAPALGNKNLLRSTMIADDVEGTDRRLGGKVIGRVNVAGNDSGACVFQGLPKDCDENFSLSARMYADGSVKGQFQDSFGDGTEVHAEIDCINFVGGDAAIVSGFFKSSSSPSFAIGSPFVTALQEGDPDFFSFLYNGIVGFDCNDYVIANFDLFEHIGGQVTVQAP